MCECSSLQFPLVQNVAAADISLLMPPLATTNGANPSATSPATRVSDPFRYFDSLRLQLRGAADALAAPPAADAAAAAAHRQLQSHTLATLVLVSLLLRESLRLVRNSSCYAAATYFLFFFS